MMSLPFRSSTLGLLGVVGAVVAIAAFTTGTEAGTAAPTAPVVVPGLPAKPDTGPGPTMPPLASAAYSVDRQEMRAQLIAKRYATLSAELGAKVGQITVKEGERFRKGQVLVVFDCVLQGAQLDKARAQQMAARNTWEGNQHMRQLNAIGEVELRNSEAELRKADADVAFLNATIDKCRITAPYGGRAGELKAREQQFVQPGQAVLEIVDDSALELEFIVPTQWLSWLKTGHKFKVQIDDTRRAYPARMVRSAARADPVSQSVKAIAVIDGSHPDLIAGMSGRVLLKPKE
jgi:membrane fusion protein, multidrug efflux system